MSVGHSRRTSRSPSPHAVGILCKRFLKVRLHAILLEAGELVHLVLRCR